MLTVGNYIENLLCESFFDHEAGRVRIRPLDGQDIPVDIKIECFKEYRNTNVYPLGTQFIAETAKVCIKPTGGIYLRAKDQVLTRV